MIADGGGSPADDMHEFMQTALSLAKRGLGQTWPNPTVGCLIVRDGQPVGRGWTQPGGRPHAETQALARAGDLASGATAVVTLEPCVHHGATPPCVDALLSAGVRRVVIAIEDPDPRVAGRGIAALSAAGVEVSVGLLGAPAKRLNHGFILRITARRPMFTLKVASTLDGRIATGSGDSRWITGDEARAQAHWLRASHDAVLIGSETAVQDDPDLTCRLPGLAPRSPLRIVADGRRRVLSASRLMQTAATYPTWVLSGTDSDSRANWPLLPALLPPGVTLIGVDRDAGGQLDPVSIAHTLADRGLTRVLIEGGGVLAASFLKAGLVDRLAWFHAPKIIGSGGRPAIADAKVERLIDAHQFRRDSVHQVGCDIVETYDRLEQ